jgi:hypothetical protein
MSMLRKVTNFAIPVAILLGTSGLGAEKPAAIPVGTTIAVKLDTTLTDKTNKTGDPFTGELTSPIVVNRREIVPQYSTVNGHVAFVKPSGRMHGKAQMRVVIDNITTPDNVVYPLSSTLQDAHGVCSGTTASAKGKGDEEGTIQGAARAKRKQLRVLPLPGALVRRQERPWVWLEWEAVITTEIANPAVDPEWVRVLDMALASAREPHSFIVFSSMKGTLSSWKGLS